MLCTKYYYWYIGVPRFELHNQKQICWHKIAHNMICLCFDKLFQTQIIRKIPIISLT